MDRVTPGGASGFLILAGVDLCLLASGALSSTPKGRTTVHSSSASSHTRTIKRTWRTGPASMPLETEVVPPHPSSVPPPAKALTLSVPGERKGGVEPGGRPSAGSTLGATPTSAAPFESDVSTNDESHNNSVYVDPEKRALSELSSLRANPGARQAFYEDLRRTVERVRAGEKDQIPDEKKPATSRP